MNTTETRPPVMPPLPPRIAKLPKNARGYPVPYFVAWIDGVPDFRVIRPETKREATEKKLCWICGEPLGAQSTFVLGPMCCVNRVNSEPPSHRQCAEFAAQACPFMLRPKMVRREDETIEAIKHNTPGIMIERNPGVFALWTTDKWTTFKDVKAGVLYNVGLKPKHISWWSAGRRATFDEVRASILSGVPLLIEACGGATEEDARIVETGTKRALDLARATT